MLGALLWLGYGYAERRYTEELRARGQTALALYAEMTRGWLNKYRALTPIYARSPVVIAALRHPEDGIRLDMLNQDLELWNSISGASDTYALDDRGFAIAASNWADPVTFVGKSYSFRPYFGEAMEGRLGRFFALGTVSGKRGYYFAHPVRDAGKILGAIVVKVAVEAIEREFRLSPNEVFISDPSGVILVSGNPALRLTTLAPLTEQDQERIRKVRQFDLEALKPAPLKGASPSLAATESEIVIALPDRSNPQPGEFLHLTQAMLAEDWVLHLLTDSAPARSQALTLVLLIAAVALALALAVALSWQWRQRLLERLRERERLQKVLEQKVAERTAGLSEANRQLQSEVAERKAAEEDLRRTQSELVQAGKLAALGQMSAALSHEFNQPLTAIRTYTENAIAFMGGDAKGKAETNMRRILRLTERMAQLSKHLTRFSRKPNDTVSEVLVRDVIAETLELLSGRLDRAGATVEVLGDPDVFVVGGHVRLQHVMMNLVANALDGARPDTPVRISIAVRPEGATTRILVDDNGRGISEADLPRIFDPFFTTKEVGQGLGLGLSITFNIIKDFGGEIRAENRAEGGARFILTLRSASAAAMEAAK